MIPPCDLGLDDSKTILHHHTILATKGQIVQNTSSRQTFNDVLNLCMFWTQWSNLFHKIVCLTMYHQTRFKSKRISSWEHITDTVIFICDVYHQTMFKSKRISSWEDIIETFIVQELCEGRGGRPGLSVLTSLLVSVDVKIYWTMLRHWSQLFPNMSTDTWGH